MAQTRILRYLLAISTTLMLLVMPVSVSAQTGATDAGGNLDPTTQFYVPKPDHKAIDQIAALTAAGDKTDAGLINTMIGTPQAVWFTGGTPQSVQQDVKNTVQRAAG